MFIQRKKEQTLVFRIKAKNVTAGDMTLFLSKKKKMDQKQLLISFKGQMLEPGKPLLGQLSTPNPVMYLHYKDDDTMHSGHIGYLWSCKVNNNNYNNSNSNNNNYFFRTVNKDPAVNITWKYIVSERDIQCVMTSFKQQHLENHKTVDGGPPIPGQPNVQRKR